jgi:predicted acetyltransferase
MAPITYHLADPADAQILTENRIRFALELSGPQPEETVDILRKQMLDFFSKATSENNCFSFIARANGEVAGIGSLHIRQVPGNFKNLSGKWGYIMNMYTVPEFRRMGICKGILNALVEEGTRHGITAFELHATPEGELVYKNNGFEIYTEPTYRKIIETK